MRFFPKLLLILLPLVIIPMVLSSVLVSRQGNNVIQDLVLRNAWLELEFFQRICEEESLPLDALGIGDMDFYRENAQRSALEYAESRIIPGAYLFVLDAQTGIPVFLPEPLDRNVITFLEDFNTWKWDVGIAVRRSYLNDFNNRAIQGTLALLLVFLFPAVFSTLLFARFVMRPIRVLETTAARLTAGDLSARADIKSRDELGRLGRAFNSMAESLEGLTRHLEDQVRARTEELAVSFDELRNAQDLLLERERMASLGDVVAGMAHEINTPIGIGVTSSTFLKDRVSEVGSQFTDGNLSRREFEEFLDDASKAAGLVFFNLDRAKHLIGNFKQLAVDQSHEELRQFNLKEYVDSILEGLYPRVKKTSVIVETDIDETLQITSYPGILYQVISNLVINSLIHGYEPGEAGSIRIQAVRKDSGLELRYEDDGRGMDNDLAARIYEPFVTTRSGEGGSGLGMNIVYNLVNRKLNGSIRLETSPGRGVLFIIRMPLEISPHDQSS